MGRQKEWRQLTSVCNIQFLIHDLSCRRMVPWVITLCGVELDSSALWTNTARPLCAPWAPPRGAGVMSHRCTAVAVCPGVALMCSSEETPDGERVVLVITRNAVDLPATFAALKVGLSSAAPVARTSRRLDRESWSRSVWGNLSRIGCFEGQRGRVWSSQMALLRQVTVARGSFNWKHMGAFPRTSRTASGSVDREDDAKLSRLKLSTLAVLSIRGG